MTHKADDASGRLHRQPPHDRQPPHKKPARYGQATIGGRLIRIASTLPPVFNPNSVPRSWIRLNSDGQHHYVELKDLQAEPVPLVLDPGDIAIFTCFTPHRSGPNLSTESRRGYFMSYNARSDGGRSTPGTTVSSTGLAPRIS